VLDAKIDDVFSPRPDELWRTVLTRQPGRLSWLALAPDDLSLN
jgi:putative transcriptional regulator